MTKKGKKKQSFKLNGYFVVFHKTRFRHFTQKQFKDFPLHYKDSPFPVLPSLFLVRSIPPFPVPPFKIAAALMTYQATNGITHILFIAPPANRGQ